MKGAAGADNAPPPIETAGAKCYSTPSSRARRQPCWVSPRLRAFPAHRRPTAAVEPSQVTPAGIAGSLPECSPQHSFVGDATPCLDHRSVDLAFAIHADQLHVGFQ
jgi:hypothetical protein